MRHLPLRHPTCRALSASSEHSLPWPYACRPARQVLRSLGVRVLTVREILAFGVEERMGARVELEELAASTLTYKLAEGECRQQHKGRQGQCRAVSPTCPSTNEKGDRSSALLSVMLHELCCVVQPCKHDWTHERHGIAACHQPVCPICLGLGWPPGAITFPGSATSTGDI